MWSIKGKRNIGKEMEREMEIKWVTEQCRYTFSQLIVKSILFLFCKNINKIWFINKNYFEVTLLRKELALGEHKFWFKFG